MERSLDKAFSVTSDQVMLIRDSDGAHLRWI
ncbi:hypothetical protein FHS17_002039 [Paenibacillus lupini]|nr:hypothetical protein [Paenibacillus lupini]